MRTIPLTQGKMAIVDDEDYEKLTSMGRRWQFANGYAVSGSNSPKNQLRMHRIILGLSRGDGTQVDHINENRLDNRKCNLRICDYSTNQANRGKPANNTSGYKGVTFHRGKNKWMASVYHKGKTLFAGYHDTPEDAAKAYDELACKTWGEFAKVNFG